MKRIFWTLRFLPVLGFLCCLAACGSSPEVDETTETTDNGEFVAPETPPPGYEREGEGAPRGDVEAPREGTAPDAPVDGERMRDVEYRWVKDRGILAMQQGRLEEAERYFLRAMELNPELGREDVAKALDEVRVQMAKPAALAPRWNELPRAQQEEFQIEADRTYKRAKELETDGNWGAALEEWQRLERLIRFAPYGAELQRDYSAVARTGKQTAETELARQRKLLEEEAQRRERRMMDLQAAADESRRREEVIELWRQAVYNLELRRFRTAEEITDRILQLDPNFRQAEELKNDIANRRLMNMNRDTFENRMRGYQEAMRSLRETTIAQTELVRYPTGMLAERIRARRQATADSVRLDPEIQRIENLLASRVVSLHYEERTLIDVIADIRAKANVNIELDKAVRENSGEQTVNFTLDEISIGNALNIILGDLDLKTTFRHGLLFVVTEDTQPDASTVVTRVHDVRDLTFNIAEFQGPRIRLQGADADTGGPSLVFPDEGEKTLDVDRIQELIEESISPGMWDAPFALEFFGGQLVATHTSQVQAELRDFLDELRKIAGLMVNIEVRFISVEDDYLQDFGIDFRGLGGPAAVPNQANIVLEDVTSGNEDNAGGQFDNGSGGIAPANPTAGIFFNNQNPNNPPVNYNQDVRGRFEHIYDNSLGNVLTNSGGFAMQFAYFVDLTQINAVIHAVQKRKKARVLTAPRLSAFNTQRANITIVNQVPYIRDFDLQTATTAAIANPVVDTILDGMVLDVKPTVSNDRRFITIEVQPTVAELLLPIPTFTTTLGPTSAVTIQIPEIRLQAVQTTVRVPDGGAVVIGGLKTVRDVFRESGVPLLSDIPLLGMLFRRQGVSKEQYNLVIVVHAKVIDLNDEENYRPGWAN